MSTTAMVGQFTFSDVQRLIDELASSVSRDFSPRQPLNIVGIRTRGEVLAARLAARLHTSGFVDIRRGVLDISLYRDDLTEIGPRPSIKPTIIDVPIDGVPMLLVDDVLFTGRSVRAALTLLGDFGRPSFVRLAVLVDRGGRELPIHADYVPLDLRQTPRDHRINVRFTEIDGVDEITIAPKHSPLASGGNP